MSKPLTTDEMLALLLTRGRVAGQRSYAQQKSAYRNPAQTVKFGRERDMKRDYDPVEGWLDLWAEDHRRSKYGDNGYKTEASGGFIVSWRKDPEEQDEARERTIIDAVEAAVNDLNPRYQKAIKLHYGLMTISADVWRHYIPATFDEAKIVIRVKMVKRDVPL